LQVTERGRVVARVVPAPAGPGTPYFARRTLLPAFKSAKLAGGTDVTEAISSERDER